MARFWKSALPAAVFSVVFLFGLSTASSEDAPPAKQPKVEITPVTFDFGTVDEGAKPKAVFTIKNAGDADLVIYDTKTSCGCTVASLSSKKLSPGEKATLEAVYNSQNASGVIHKSVSVSTNDPKSKLVSLTITGNVKSPPAPDITLSSFNVTNLQMSAGSMTTRSIKVTNTGQLDLTVSEVTATQGITATLDSRAVPPGQRVKFELTIKPGETRVLDITIAPRNPSGVFREAVTIRSNAKRRPVVTFEAMGVVQG